MLFIEDDPEVRAQWTARLRALGHEVTAVAAGDAPLRVGFDAVVDGAQAAATLGAAASGAASLPALAARLRELAARIGPPELQGRLSGFAGYLALLDEPGADVTRTVELPPLLERLLALAGAEIARSAQVVRRFDPCPPVRGTTRQLAQLFVNLVINAAQAMAPGQAAPSTIEVRTGTGDDGWAVIEIVDNGPGIPEALRERIFEPYFTTRGAAGQGLGLPISRDVATTLGGTLVVDSEVGRGSSFRVRLPPVPE